ncbi:MAG: type II secretion system F family protein [Bryobacteraceae bacterium]|nr:type II secretion system F family protein [Bryobacteraceae bacterium]
MYLFIAFLVFSCALFTAAWYAFTVPRNEHNRALAGRLRELRARGGTRSRSSQDLFRREERGSLAAVGDFIEWVGVIRRLQLTINQADLRYRAPEVASFCVILFVATYVILGLFIPVLMVKLVAAVVVAAIPILYILWTRNARIAKFEQQLPDCIDLFNRSMKAGHNIHSGLDTIASETPEPARGEFRKVVEELALGSQLDSALRNLGGRIPLIDLRFFITSLILQRQTGANMVEVLGNLSLLVRERLHLVEKMKASTAQQRFSAALLCSMPIVFAIGLWFLKREYIVLLYTDETGSKFLTYAIISELLGILIIRQIANPKF